MDLVKLQGEIKNVSTGGVYFAPLNPYQLPNGLYITGARLPERIESYEGDRGTALVRAPYGGRCEVLEWHPD